MPGVLTGSVRTFTMPSRCDATGLVPTKESDRIPFLLADVVELVDTLS